MQDILINLEPSETISNITLKRNKIYRKETTNDTRLWITDDSKVLTEMGLRKWDWEGYRAVSPPTYTSSGLVSTDDDPAVLTAIEGDKLMTTQTISFRWFLPDGKLIYGPVLNMTGIPGSGVETILLQAYDQFDNHSNFTTININVSAGGINVDSTQSNASITFVNPTNHSESELFWLENTKEMEGGGYLPTTIVTDPSKITVRMVKNTGARILYEYTIKRDLQTGIHYKGNTIAFSWVTSDDKHHVDAVMVSDVSISNTRLDATIVRMSTDDPLQTDLLLLTHPTDGDGIGRVTNIEAEDTNHVLLNRIESTNRWSLWRYELGFDATNNDTWWIDEKLNVDWNDYITNTPKHIEYIIPIPMANGAILTQATLPATNRSFSHDLVEVFSFQKKTFEATFPTGPYGVVKPYRVTTTGNIEIQIQEEIASGVFTIEYTTISTNGVGGNVSIQFFFTELTGTETQETITLALQDNPSPKWENIAGSPMVLPAPYLGGVMNVPTMANMATDGASMGRIVEYPLDILTPITKLVDFTPGDSIPFNVTGDIKYANATAKIGIVAINPDGRMSPVIYYEFTVRHEVTVNWSSCIVNMPLLSVNTEANITIGGLTHTYSNGQTAIITYNFEEVKNLKFRLQSSQPGEYMTHPRDIPAGTLFVKSSDFFKNNSKFTVTANADGLPIAGSKEVLVVIGGGLDGDFPKLTLQNASGLNGMAYGDTTLQENTHTSAMLAANYSIHYCDNMDWYWSEGDIPYITQHSTCPGALQNVNVDRSWNALPRIIWPQEKSTLEVSGGCRIFFGTWGIDRHISSMVLKVGDTGFINEYWTSPELKGNSNWFIDIPPSVFTAMNAASMASTGTFEVRLYTTLTAPNATEPHLQKPRVVSLRAKGGIFAEVDDQEQKLIPMPWGATIKYGGGSSEMLGIEVGLLPQEWKPSDLSYIVNIDGVIAHVRWDDVIYVPKTTFKLKIYNSRDLGPHQESLFYMRTPLLNGVNVTGEIMSNMQNYESEGHEIQINTTAATGSHYTLPIDVQICKKVHEAKLNIIIQENYGVEGGTEPIHVLGTLPFQIPRVSARWKVSLHGGRGGVIGETMVRGIRGTDIVAQGGVGLYMGEFKEVFIDTQDMMDFYSVTAVTNNGGWATIQRVQ